MALCEGLYPGIEEIGVKCLLPNGGSLFDVCVYCKSLANWVLLLGPREMEITGHEIEIVWRVMHDLPAVAV
jgi:hypothetical protein